MGRPISVEETKTGKTYRFKDTPPVNVKGKSAKPKTSMWKRAKQMGSEALGSVVTGWNPKKKGAQRLRDIGVGE